MSHKRSGKGRITTLHGIVIFNSAIIVLLAGCFLLFPAFRAIVDLQDPALRKPGVPKAAWRLYRDLTPRYAAWAKERVNDGKAQLLSVNDISGTEWPLFGSLFYLWTTENLQSAWNSGDHSLGVEPKVFARDAIIAASELVIDPKHATWVKKHWGDDYLHRQNVFYRMLIIGALAARENLLHDRAHLDLLRDQTDTLAKELEASPTGLLEDYPGECYPGDVIAALMCIQRADRVLGTNHVKLIAQSLRAFVGAGATRYSLPPYAANANSGRPIADSRGCGNAYMCLTAPELWPGPAYAWFEAYERFFWQERLTGAGFREYAKDAVHSDWFMDVDAGPVIAGYGISANAFGIGAARKNGRFDRAFPLTAEMLATVCELPNGTLAIPRILSDAAHAPLLGETAVIWQMSIQPQTGFLVRLGGSIPLFVYLLLGIMILLGGGLSLRSLESMRSAFFERKELNVPFARFQVGLWGLLMVMCIVAAGLGHYLIGLAVLVWAVMFPVIKRKRAPNESDDCSEGEPAKELKKTAGDL